MKFRTNLEFVENALSVLKLKRDRLAAELNHRLQEMERRNKAEERLTKIYSNFKFALAMLGYSEVYSASHSVERINVKVTEDHIMNITVPILSLEAAPSLKGVGDPALNQTGRDLHGLIGELLEIASMEASIERMAFELSVVNRKINAIEKLVVPFYRTNVKYIEDFLSDEELEDFTRVKHVKVALREKEK